MQFALLYSIFLALCIWMWIYMYVCLWVLLGLAAFEFSGIHSPHAVMIQLYLYFSTSTRTYSFSFQCSKSMKGKQDRIFLHNIHKDNKSKLLFLLFFCMKCSEMLLAITIYILHCVIIIGMIIYNIKNESYHHRESSNVYVFSCSLPHPIL